MHDACVFFFLYHPRVFSAHDTVKLPSSRTSYPGSHGTHSSPFPTTVLAFVVSVAKKKKSSELGSLPWRPLALNWFAFMQPTSILRSTLAARRFLRLVRILVPLFQALISTRTNTYIISSYSLLVVVNVQYMSCRIDIMRYIYRMISVSRYPEHILEVDIDKSRQYRMIYREFQVRYRTPLEKNSVPTYVVYGGTQVFPPVCYLQLIHTVVRTQDFQPTASRADRINL